MPPKKVEEPKEIPLWGRPGNTLKMGIVGMPNVGKSTTFNLLSNLNVPAENYPFCTVEPNKATVPVPDERFTKLCEMFKPQSEVSAVRTSTNYRSFRLLILLDWCLAHLKVKASEMLSSATSNKLMAYTTFSEPSMIQT
jgi:hypothetical protein